MRISKKYLLLFLMNCLLAVTAIAAAPERQWKFRTEGAATGALQSTAKGEYCLDANLANFGLVEMNAPLSADLKIRSIQFQIRSPFQRVGVWFQDSEKQIHQEFITLSGNPNVWNEVEVTCKGSPGSHWGGANDGKFRGPPLAVGIRVHRSDLQNVDQAKVYIRDIEFSDGKKEKRLHSWSIPNPVRMFRRPNDSTPVEFELVFLPQKNVETLAYQWLDYSGEKVGSGEAKCDSNGKLLVPPPKGKGFFELKIPDLELEAGLFIADAPPEKNDEYFAMDSSFSWGSPPNDELPIRQYLQILRENGIIWNRDRLSWKGIEKEKGEINFKNRFGTYRDAAQKENIDTLDTFHDAPAWSGTEFKENTLQNPYPQQLREFAQSFVQINRRWNKTQKALEVWNEPDISFGNYLPPWYVCSLVKAFSRGAADASLPVMIGGGVFANAQKQPDLFEIYLRNGLLDDCDFLSYHSYDEVSQIERMVVQMREQELKYAGKRAGIPHWITECGMPRPFAGHDGHRGRLSDDLYSSAEISGKAAEFRALGAEKFFFFEYKYRKENEKNFGNMDAHSTPMRALAGYFQTVRVLSGREYVGDLNSVNAIRARVFKNDQNAVAVIYNGVRRGKQLEVELPSQMSVLKVEGLDGRPLRLNGRNIPNSDGITFVYFPLHQLNALVKNSTVAMRYYQMAKHYQRQERAAKPLVMQCAGTVDDVYRNLLSRTDVKWQVRIWNFSDQPLEFVPELEMSEQQIIVEPPKSLIIPARETGMTEFRVRLPEMKKEEKSVRCLITLKDKNNQATPIVFVVEPQNPIVYSVGSLPPKQMQQIDKWHTTDGKTLNPDIRAAFRAFHENGFLRIQVSVDDQKHVNPNTAHNSWRGDSIQVALEERDANGNPDLPRVGSNVRHTEFVVAKCNDGDVLYAHLPQKTGHLKKSNAIISHANGKTLYDVWIDPGELKLSLQENTQIGCAIVVNSADEDGRHGYLAWGDGIASDTKSNLKFNRLSILK